MILPAILILLLVSALCRSHQPQPLRAQDSQGGIQLGVLSLILYATWSYGAIAIEGWLDLLLGHRCLCRTGDL